MPISNIEFANYNQTTVRCKYCPSEVKRSKLPFHVAKCHNDELIKERARAKEIVKEVQFPDTPSVVPERPICRVVPNENTENWDDSNYSPYNPLLATSHKPVIRGTYYIGRSSQEKQMCREFENLRMAHIIERNPDNFETSDEPEVFVDPVSQPEIKNDDDFSEESWSESSISIHSARSELDEDSFKTCTSGLTYMPTSENLNSFEASVAEYLRSLPEETRAEVMQKFTNIMREQ